MHTLPSLFRRVRHRTFPSANSWRIFSVLAILTLPVVAFAAGAAQSSDLAPKKTDGGVLFQYSAPGASAVYLAGDFNSWANATDGKIAGTEAKMDGPDAQGVWRKVVKLEAGDHAFKFNLDAAVDKWVVPEWAALDKDGNATISITASGDVAGLKTAEAPAADQPISEEQMAPQQKDGRVTFRFLGPEATMVYLAGDFNNWADNQQAVVTDPKHAMIKNANGVWQMELAINPGSHAYKFVVDGTWVNDPHVFEKDGDGNSVLNVN